MLTHSPCGAPSFYALADGAPGLSARAGLDEFHGWLVFEVNHFIYLTAATVGGVSWWWGRGEDELLDGVSQRVVGAVRWPHLDVAHLRSGREAWVTFRH